MPPLLPQSNSQSVCLWFCLPMYEDSSRPTVAQAFSRLFPLNNELAALMLLAIF
jgi:hypothetical protein